jgi:NGFI-A-binding protein
VEAEFNEMSRDENMPSAALTAAAKFLDPLGAAIHVLSTSGGNIIAVANPALALSPALVESLAVKREVISPELE